MLAWTCAWLAAVAPASEIDEPLRDLLPLRNPDEMRWQNSDRAATSLGRAGGLVTVVGLGAATAGTLMLATGNELDSEGLTGLGALGAATGVVGLVVGPPLLLGGSLRSAHSLRSRGVWVTNVPGTLGWLCYAFTLPVAVVPAPTGPLLAAPIFAASVGLGFVQLHANALHRSEARLESVSARRALRIGVLPAPRGAALVGTF